jgi:hypothetical protein
MPPKVDPTEIKIITLRATGGEVRSLILNIQSAWIQPFDLYTHHASFTTC